MNASFSGTDQFAELGFNEPNWFECAIPQCLVHLLFWTFAQNSVPAVSSNVREQTQVVLFFGLGQAGRAHRCGIERLERPLLLLSLFFVMSMRSNAHLGPFLSPSVTAYSTRGNVTTSSTYVCMELRIQFDAHRSFWSSFSFVGRLILVMASRFGELYRILPSDKLVPQECDPS